MTEDIQGTVNLCPYFHQGIPWLMYNIILYYFSKTKGWQLENGTHAFILHWQDQVRKYEALVPVSNRSSEGPNRTMLQNAVHKIAELRAVKQQAAQHKTQSGFDLTYLQYCNHLLSAPTEYALQFDIKKSSKTSYWQVYEHSDLDVIQANITEHFNSQKARLLLDKNGKSWPLMREKFGINFRPTQNQQLLVLRISRGLQ